MLIDWFTVCAQVLNFLILIWLMKRFLYKPILSAIDAREALVSMQIADADDKQKQAASERDEFEKKNHRFDKHHAAMLSKANDEVKAERARLLAEANKAADAVAIARQAALDAEAKSLSESIKTRAQSEIFAIARKTLADLASETLEERMTDVFVKRISEMDAETKLRLSAAVQAATEPSRVSSAFALAPKQRLAIQDSINAVFGKKVHLDFVTAPELVAGLEFTTNGQQLEWSISYYLDSLGKDILELVSKDKVAEAAA